MAPMPRWDTSDASLAGQIEDALGYAPDAEDEVDVCAGCHRPHLGEVMHPPYAEMDFVCDVCGVELQSWDD